MEIWKFLAGGPPAEDPSFLEAMGFEGMTDEVRARFVNLLVNTSFKKRWDI